ncbi:hypothetical protein GGR43_002404 [Sphingobium jiangsuense]|uniref:3'-phosphate/5'-hydroxy nucleic acid ligase n=1 Tax=Sphingobium jiangsuense TaxID=870476 RepID=A0A7W6FR58_9SPHN|nr:hypothetical protein [Sphingobium jiangsuense]
MAACATLVERFDRITAKYPRFRNTNQLTHLGTLGTGNHFIELCLDTEQRVCIMLHSGSRGVGNAIGTFFIELAKQDMRKWFINLPDEDLAYFPEGADHFDGYVEAVEWAQDFAALNRRMMMTNVIRGLRGQIAKPFEAELEAVNCHHNYVRCENHFVEDVFVTRKGAVRAAKGTMGIIPSMGAKSFIVRGLGNAESFESCSHGAGRVMSRTQAKPVSLDEHIADTADVECRKDEGVIERDAQGLQADRSRDGRAGRSGRDRPYVETGVRQRLTPWRTPLPDRGSSCRPSLTKPFPRLFDARSRHDWTASSRRMTCVSCWRWNPVRAHGVFHRRTATMMCVSCMCGRAAGICRSNPDGM